MIVVNEDNIVSGNTVLQPEYVPYIDQEKEKKDLRRKKFLRQKRIKDKIKIIRNIVSAFVIGIILVGKYCVIYNMQQELNSVNTNINELNRENENIKVDLVKYNNVQYIESIAINKLHMISPDKGSAIYTDLEKENIKSPDKKMEKQESKHLWNKLAKILF